MNRVVIMRAFVASEGPLDFPGISGQSLDLMAAERAKEPGALALAEPRKVAPVGGTYVAESSHTGRQMNWPFYLRPAGWYCIDLARSRHTNPAHRPVKFGRYQVETFLGEVCWA